jgi:hypothetical protein
MDVGPNSAAIIQPARGDGPRGYRTLMPMKPPELIARAGLGIDIAHRDCDISRGFVATSQFVGDPVMRPCVPAALLLAVASSASAQVTLNATMTADNAFTAFISSDPTAAGTSFLSGNNWPQTFTGSVILPGAGTYYLNITAQDFGAPMMLIGLFTLDDASAVFQNGQQSLVTNSTDWTASSTGYADAGVTPANLGPNGTGPWGTFPAIGSDARFIWHPQSPSTAYFTTVITVVPAPAAVIPLASLALLAARRRR